MCIYIYIYTYIYIYIEREITICLLIYINSAAGTWALKRVARVFASPASSSSLVDIYIYIYMIYYNTI